MRYVQRVGKIPDGNTPAVGVSVAVRKISDGSTLTTLISDADGFVTLIGNGHYEPFFLFLGNVPGGDKLWDSRNSITAGVLPLAELPVALRAFGDGVIRGYLNDLAVTLSGSGTSVIVGTGAANVAGHPVVIYASFSQSISRPVSGVRIDRAILRLYPTGSGTTPGLAEWVILPGTVDAGVPALTQTATVHEIALAQISVPVAGAITLTDERAFAGEKLTVSGVDREDLITTTSAVGVALSGPSLTLVLPRAATYDVEADFHAIQSGSASVTAWVLQGTFGSLGSGNDNFNTPAQVAVSATHVYIADTANNRLVKRLLSTGAFVSAKTGLIGITGMSVDSSANIYLTGGVALAKYSSAFVQQWSTSPGLTLRHTATDGTHVYATDSGDNKIWKRLCSTGAAVTSWGSPGTGNGQFNSPYGIAVGGGFVYVVDAGNLRVQKFTTAGVYVTQWAISANARGCALDASGDVLVAEYGADAVKRYTNTGTFIDQFSQVDPDGLAVATGDVVWVSNAGSSNIAKWDEASTPGGHGQVAIEIDGNLSPYSGIGQRDGALSVVEVGSKAGPGTCLVRAFGKATANTMTLRSAVLSARATPRS